MDVTQSRPDPPRDKEAARTRALAELRQGVWEASQFLSSGEIREYVDGVIHEIVADEP